MNDNLKARIDLIQAAQRGEMSIKAFWKALQSSPELTNEEGDHLERMLTRKLDAVDHATAKILCPAVAGEVAARVAERQDEIILANL